MTELGNLLVALGLQALLIATPLALGLALVVRMTRDLHPRLRYLPRLRGVLRHPSRSYGVVRQLGVHRVIVRKLTDSRHNTIVEQHRDRGPRS